ncbi:MAG: alpha/beta fold hydrolase [Chloroflexi bacterium]|nr:alpha/beta fold hydrolase [Chloroflexota bacterium]MBI3168948.1 alpha/beta fold hydrolase [Chloroflexota bacterium]
MPKVHANGVELYYELYGSEAAPLLVLNNGIIMNATTSWAFQTKALAQHYRILQYDCRGQGQSEHPVGKYSMEMHADDLAALLTTLNVDKAHIAGISYGGEVAQAFGLKYHERTLSLILADTVSEVGAETRIILDGWLDSARAADANAFFNATAPWNFSPAFIAANPALLADAKGRYKLLDYPAVVRLCECFLNVNFTAHLGELKCPTCIIVGSLDILKGPAYAAILKAGIPHAEMHVLQGAGHASCWERPQEFNSAILGFLAKQD